ncbi:DUF418 domain-containing protein [Sorangium sp. So ce341]|uniref:DUF418 domain-containing protein n=1 Tax=Sorangium sp. So ce341 TaxID=3133302 RepID=UPI003F63311F
MTATRRADAEPARAKATGAAPTAAAERIPALDVLRGFALYGVLLANAVAWFSGRAFMTRDQLIAQRGPADEVFLVLLNLFVDGKAMTLLTFLFGLGFALQLQRAEADGRSVLPTHFRRLAALAFIGVCHVLLLWWGDILWGYAIAGVGLALFRRVRGAKLLAWAAALTLVPQLVASIPAVSKVIAHVTPEPADLAAFKAQVFAAITGHDRGALAEIHVKQAYYHVGRIWTWYFAWVLGRYLVGYWAGTTRLLQDADERLPFFRKLLAWGLALGIAGSSLMAGRRLLQRHGVAVPESVGLALVIPAELGAMALASAYAAAVVLLMQKPAWRRALMRIAPVGQMALTSYLLQSLICTFLFYGWGLGLAGRLRPVYIAPITVAVFVLEVLLARAWLSRFRFGPAEWLWRSLTYGRLQPLRITAGSR